MIITVASGKGGTGKTTVATNLAFSLADHVQFLDCDVEEPNAHLFLKPALGEKQRVFTPVPVVDETACSYCRKCAEICRFRAITVLGKKVLTFPEMCHSCGGCMEICPERAITETGRELGVIEEGRRDDIGFVHGRLRVGEAMAPPLIRKVLSHVLPGKVNIIDAPPGTSCPVITAMRGADFVLLVTEPTPFGLHDLKLAVETVKILGLPRGLIINRAGIGDDGVKEYAEEEGLPVLMEIPFERSIAEACSRGRLVVEALPGWKEEFLELFRRIRKTIGWKEVGAR